MIPNIIGVISGENWELSDCGCQNESVVAFINFLSFNILYWGWFIIILAIKLSPWKIATRRASLMVSESDLSIKRLTTSNCSLMTASLRAVLPKLSVMLILKSLTLFSIWITVL